MSILTGFTITEKLADGSKSVIYRAIRDEDGLGVVLKVFRQARPSPVDIARFMKEYELIRDMGIEGVIATHGLVEDRDRIALILEDFNGISLKEFMQSRKFGIERFLEIAISISDTLSLIHSRNIIHRDIKPHNILYNPTTGAVKVTDFGISSLLALEQEDIYNPLVISGTLPYMSPEQTGRISRPVDYRTDLYSLGITFYEMLTGRVPFKSRDPLEIIYSHIAREPESPSTMNGEVPDQISAIVMKLLSKDIDGRYQNCRGLKSDLQECLLRLKTDGRITPFDLGRNDVSDRFGTPHAFIGREKEMILLVEAFNRVCQGGGEAVAVSGPPGIGKSALVHRMEGEVTARRGYFLTSRYEADKQNTPYSAIIHAFQKLMLRIIAEGPERTALWKDRILSALGDNCRIIIDVIPELELIVESHPELPEILSDKSQHRFNKVFGDFVRLFSRGDHPLVIFLDDIQWADHASLQLLDRLMSGIDTSYILLVLSYRDTEVGPDHPIAQMMLEMADRLSHIVLDPLSSSQLGEYLSSMIHSGSGDIAGLADQVHRKTNGNPFFMINFMRALHENGLLSFVSSQWTWDLEKIKEMKASDNVVELMAAKIRGLSPGTSEVLKFAACAGNRADIEGLVLLSGRSIATVLTDIQEALDEGLLFHSRNNYHFVHDRIQEIVYSMIPPEERTAIHYRIGCFCLEKAGEGNLLEKIFYVAHQLNSGSGLMGSREERLRLARINLMAGRKAKDSTAYAEAAEFLGKGIGMMEDDAWNGEYRLVWDLHFEKAESEYLNGDFQGAFRIFDELMHRAENVIDRAKVYDRLIIMHTNTGSQRRGMELGLEALQMFGIRIPRKAGRVVLLGEIAKATFFLGRRRIPELLDSPEVKDPETIMAMTLCMNTGTAAYFVDSTIVALLAMKLVNMSLKHGNTSIASFAYLSFGLILGYGIGLFRTAFEFGGLAIRLNEKFNNIDLKPRILFIFGFLISHWRRHYSETIQLLRESYRNGIETGDLNYAVFSATNIIQYRMWLGDNLDQVYQELMGYRDFIFRAKNEEFIYEFILARQYILSHKGRTKSLSDYSDDAFDEKEFVEKIMKFRVTTHSYYIFKITSLYFDRKYREALDIAENADHSIGEVLYAQTNVAIFYLFYSLTLTALYAEADMRTRRKFRVRLAKNQALMKKWAAQCPENYLHGHHLVEAEIAAMKGRTTRAAALYDRAIDTARESGFLRIAAIASARAGEFYLSCNRDIIARAYFSEAYYLFSRHGSTMIASELSRLFPQDAPHHHTAAATDTTSEQTTGSSGTRSLDLTTLLKTTQIISGEIVLEKLLKKLVVVIGESAAATNGALILEKDGKLLIEASGDIVSGRINVLQDMPIDSSSEISPAVVHYVARTKENLVLNDAVNIGLFTNDPYIMRKRCKSVLCIPIMYQAKLSAIFYAENNLTIHAFTEERIELLKTIASYAAISVDNARLYANLEEKVSERTRALEFAYDQVTEAYRIIQEDISLARRIQENLLTYRLERESPFNVDVHFYPMSEVGGDIYNIVEIKPGILRVFIADATGHGIQAALVTMLIRSEYEKVKTRHIHPSEIMGIINNEFIERYTNLPVLYTCVIADIDAHAQQIRYASAGHPDQYMLHDGRISVLSRTGKIIGFMRNLTYKQGELPFMPGDKIILFTDGIYEEFDMDLKEYGEKRLLDVVRRYSGEPVRVITKNILDDVRSFIGKERINASDDVTMIGIELKEGGEGSLV